MDYGNRTLADRLAAEYVLGTLRGPARRRFEALQAAHPTLGQARRDWERRLAALSTVAQPVAPSPRVWARIEQRLFDADGAQTTAQAGAGAGMAPTAQAASPALPPSSAKARPSPGRPNQAEGFLPRAARWWQQLALWQGATGLATAAALVLALLLALPPTAQPPIVVVMAAQPIAAGDAGAGIRPVSFVASVSGDGRSLVLKPLDAGQQVALNKALELWAVPAKGQPRSLGLVSGSRATTLLRTSLLDDTAAFAVSVEPPGGSPTGAPTGPIISVGKIDSI